jgi:hypothetical protein
LTVVDDVLGLDAPDVGWFDELGAGLVEHPASSTAAIAIDEATDLGDAYVMVRLLWETCSTISSSNVHLANHLVEIERIDAESAK